MACTLANVPNQKISSLSSPELAEKQVSCLLTPGNEQQAVGPGSTILL